MEGENSRKKLSASVKILYLMMAKKELKHVIK
jgi:hypothetical protein